MLGRWLRWLVLLGLGSIGAELAIAQDRHLYNYSMRHALPEQVLPALNAQISSGSAITPYNQQLILNVAHRAAQTIGCCTALAVNQRSQSKPK
jgi:hypothetical protein